MNKKITPAQVEAAKLRIILDRKLNRETPAWVTDLSKQIPSRREEVANEEEVDYWSTFLLAAQILEQREDQIRKSAASRALADAADSMPEMNGAAYMYYVRTWLHNRAKDAFRGDA